MVASTELHPTEDKFSYTFLAYTGAFMFAIVLVILVHEIGHYLAYQLRGYDGVTVRINPFMGATTYSGNVREEDFAWIILGGSIFDLSIALLVSVFQRFLRGFPRLLLSAYAANAFLLEGVVILSGLFFAETVTDFAWLEQLGWPRPVITGLGIVFVLTATALIVRLWAFMGVKRDTPLTRRLALTIPNIVYFAMCPIFLQVIQIDSDFFRRLTLVNLAWVSVILLGLTVIAPWLLSRKREGLPFPVDRKIGTASMVFGVLAWVVSYTVLN